MLIVFILKIVKSVTLNLSMKRSFRSINKAGLFYVLLVLAVFIGCKDTAEREDEKKPDLKESQLLGKWEITEMDFDDVADKVLWEYALIFSEENEGNTCLTYKIHNYEQCFDGTWKTEGDRIILKTDWPEGEAIFDIRVRKIRRDEIKAKLIMVVDGEKYGPDRIVLIRMDD